ARRARGRSIRVSSPGKKIDSWPSSQRTRNRSCPLSPTTSMISPLFPGTPTAWPATEILSPARAGLPWTVLAIATPPSSLPRVSQIGARRSKRTAPARPAPSSRPPALRAPFDREEAEHDPIVRPAVELPLSGLELDLHRLRSGERDSREVLLEGAALLLFEDEVVDGGLVRDDERVAPGLERLDGLAVSLERDRESWAHRALERW